MEDILLYFSLKYKGQFDLIYKALERKERVDESLKEELFKTIKSSYTTIISDDYPQQLKYINCPPFVLYYYGSLSLLDKDCIAVIGKRDCSEYGVQATRVIVKEPVKNDIVIVSGMAKGIDGVSHRTAIRSKGHTVAVLGSGIDYPYPPMNEDLYYVLKNELVLSEYPGSTPPRKDHFPKRNRIIAGLSKKLLVTEADLKSGTMITVGFALEQGKDVLAVPGRVYDSKGCNALIQQGAKLVMNVEDILEE